MTIRNLTPMAKNQNAKTYSSAVTGRNTATGQFTSVAPKSGQVNVVRTLTLPGGKKIRVLRQDALNRAFSRSSE